MGKSSTFLIFSSNLDQFFLFFLKLNLFSSSFRPSGWASRSPGKALATPLKFRCAQWKFLLMCKFAQCFVCLLFSIYKGFPLQLFPLFLASYVDHKHKIWWSVNFFLSIVYAQITPTKWYLGFYCEFSADMWHRSGMISWCIATWNMKSKGGSTYGPNRHRPTVGQGWFKVCQKSKLVNMEFPICFIGFRTKTPWKMLFSQ